MGALSGGGVCLIRDANKCWGLLGGQAGICGGVPAFLMFVLSVEVRGDARTVVRGEAAIGVPSCLPGPSP